MQSVCDHGKILPTRGGFFCCPYCGGKLLEIDPETEAKAVPVYCKKCRRTLRVDIHKSQSHLRPSLFVQPKD